MAKTDNILKKSEKQEIVSDVKEAFDKAKNNSNLFDNKKGKNNILVVVFSVIIVLIISFGIIYWYLSSNPKTIFISSTNAIFENLISDFDDGFASGSIDVDYEISTGNTDLNRYDFKVDYTLDEKNNISNNVVSVNRDGSSLSEMIFYNDNKVYLLIPSLNDKYIVLGDNNFNYNSDDIRVIIKYLKLAFLEGINSYKFSSSKVSLKIDDKLKQTNKISLYLKNADINLVLDKMYQYLNNDNKFMKSYKNVFNTGDLSDDINKIKSLFQNSDDITINIYTSGFDNFFVKFELISSKDGKLDTVSVSNLSNNKYSILVDNTSKGEKEEYLISFDKSDNSFAYDIDIKREKKDLNILDMKVKLNIKEENPRNIKKENMNDVLDYNMLSNDEKQKVDDNLMPLKSFIKELTKK